MSALPLTPAHRPGQEITILRLFEHLDLCGVDGAIADVEVTLASGQCLTVTAGGTGVRSTPHQSYEVLFDHDPPRFWTRYTDVAGLVYAYVPRLLISHYITRAGGIADARRTVRRARPAVRDAMVMLAVEGPARRRLERMLAHMDGVDVISVSDPH